LSEAHQEDPQASLRSEPPYRLLAHQEDHRVNHQWREPSRPWVPHPWLAPPQVWLAVQVYRLQEPAEQAQVQVSSTSQVGVSEVAASAAEAWVEAQVPPWAEAWVEAQVPPWAEAPPC